MSRNAPLLAALLLALLLPGQLQAQQPVSAWSPPSRSMPEMPRGSQADAAWLVSVANWLESSAAVTGVPAASVRATGEGGSSGGPARFIRFTSGPLPVASWSDRNGDGRADLIVLFRGAAVAAELIDADYDGLADVLRLYDARGTLARETRLP
jgi:hypothetical protein